MDGEWEVRRTGGFLPPMSGLVRKRVAGDRGWTIVGGLRMPFDVQGRELRYRFPLQGLVDVLVPDGEDSYAGTAMLFGRRIGRFRMTRRSPTRRS
ncbi:MAG: hypothetical protein ACJ768_17795 [Gaiellaceae bacterium]